MDMTGQERIAAGREAVWRALNDPDILRQCIPGCETLEKLDDTHMTATVAFKVGPVSAKFSGSVALSDLDPPNGYVISGEGKGGPAGFAKGRAAVTLTAEDGNATLLAYTVKADIGGKLAQLGSRLIDSTAKKLAGEFFAKFGALVSAGAATTDAPAAPPPPAPAEQGARSKLPLILGAAAAAIAALALIFLR